MALAFRAGIGAQEFWRLTPFQTYVLIDAWGESVGQQYEIALWQAWHIGLFSKWIKKLPPLRKMMESTHNALQGKKPSRESKIAEFRAFFSLQNTKFKG